jgi:hypothetical protein
MFFFLETATFFSPFHALNRKILNKCSGGELLQYATAIPLIFKSAILLIFSLFAKKRIANYRYSLLVAEVPSSGKETVS